MKTSLLTTIIKQLRKVGSSIGSSLAEKPKAHVDELAMEHFLLYHGLVGTQDERQRQFRDVRVDIIEAIANGSSVAMAAALKLPPLWWEERLESILAEITKTSTEKREQAIAVLLGVADNPDKAYQSPEIYNPVLHQDWRVRANAANLLAFLQAKEAVPKLIDSLNDTTGGAAPDKTPAFCYIAFALAELATLDSEACQSALLPYLYADESWFRVDAARALTNLKDKEKNPEIIRELCKAVLSHHRLSDYMAVTIAEKHNPKDLLAKEEIVQQGALEIIIGVLEASAQTFSSDIVLERGIIECWPQVRNLNESNPSPRLLRAARKLALWLQSHVQDPDFANEILERLPEHSADQLNQAITNTLSSITAPRHKDLLLASLQKTNWENTLQAGQARHALFLIGDLSVYSAVPELVQLASPDYPLLPELVLVLGELQDASAANTLIKLSSSLINLEARRAHANSNRPVEEEEAREALIYWTILKSLGQMPSTEAVEYLLKATEDFAPDKRGQALASLVNTYKKLYQTLPSAEQTYGEQINEAIMRGLHDSAPTVKVCAIDGAASLSFITSLPTLVKLINSSEVSVKRACLAALEELATHGYIEEVKTALEAKIKGETNQFRRQLLQECLTKCQKADNV
jgi:HEAT repeat protein